MYTTNLRKVEDSVMLTIPPSILDAVGLAVDTKVNILIDGGRLVVEQRRQPSYTLEELLSQCNPSLDFSPEEKGWLDTAAVGKELL
jgi:antitoxin ChpS